MKKIKLLMPILGISAIAATAIPLASCSCNPGGQEEGHYVTDVTQDEWTAAWNFFDPENKPNNRNFTWKGTIEMGESELCVVGVKERKIDYDEQGEVVTGGKHYFYSDTVNKQAYRNDDDTSHKWQPQEEYETASDVVWTAMQPIITMVGSISNLEKDGDHYKFTYDEQWTKKGWRTTVNFYFTRTTNGVRIAKYPSVYEKKDEKGEITTQTSNYSITYGSTTLDDFPQYP